MIAKTYLGDGAYVEYTGYNIIISIENGLETGLETTNRVYLGPSEWARLVAFVDRVQASERSETSPTGPIVGLDSPEHQAKVRQMMDDVA